MEKPDGLKLTDEQVLAMMEWQSHSAYWIVSQAIALTRVSEQENLELGEDDVLAASIELFKIAREDDRNRVADGVMISPEEIPQ